MALLGEDGKGYELALKLESHGVWRTWLGDSLYSSFKPFLGSPATWDAFMRSDDSKPRNHIHLQLRARALLYDKASASLFIRSKFPLPVSKLNPHYLELHGDDLYFTLESSLQNGDQRQQGFASNASIGKVSSKSSIVGSRYSESEIDVASKRYKQEDFPETWYSQFFEKYRASKSYRLMFGDKESEKRTPELMSAYLRVVEGHKRRRVIFQDTVPHSQGSTVVGEAAGMDDALLFPETMFTLNCLPDGAVAQVSSIKKSQKVPFNGILDNLPPVMAKGPVINPIMIERLGIRPEYLSTEQGLQASGVNAYKGNRKLIGEEQALQMSQKVTARILANVGFESSSESSLGVLGELLGSHTHKFGRILKLLADSYRNQCSAIELVRMFLQTTGHSDLGSLSEIMKDNAKSSALQMQQQAMSIQAQVQLQQHPSIQQSQQQQILRQMSTQMQQMTNPQYLVFQQQQHMERIRRRQQQQQSPRPNMNMGMNMDKDRQLVQVKMENPSDFPIETSSFTGTNTRNPQQLRQQQLAAISSLHAQANQNNFRPMASLAVPQMQASSIGMARAPPVKVEGFQELMGAESSLKHTNDENKLLQPQK